MAIFNIKDKRRIFLKFIFMFCFGTILGSFFSLCVERVPKGERVLSSNSHCTNCHSQLKHYDLIPLLSFIKLKGKCRYCNEKIDIQHIIIEILTGVIFVILLKYFNLSLDFIKYIVLFSILIISAFIDYNTQYVFFSVSIIGIINGVLFLILDILNGEKILSIILSILIPLLIIGIIMFIIKKIKKMDGIGCGDLEIFLLLSLYLNLKIIILTMYLSLILVSFVGGLKYIYGQRTRYVAFVPYIFVATFISVIFHENIIRYFFMLIGV